MRLIYSAIIRLYASVILLASLFNDKAKRWIAGRKNLSKGLRKVQFRNDVYWFHFASLGEFEQGKPIMERLKKAHPNSFLLVTFFSPSGYEIRKHYELADHVCYLPLDLPNKVREFVEIVNPKAVFFIKYEFWFNLLKELNKRNIPTFLISGIFRPKQHFFKWYGKWFRKHLTYFDYFFLQNDLSSSLLQEVGITNHQVSGDTRFDRVKEIAAAPQAISQISGWKDNRDVIIIGSNWPKDDELLIPFINNHIEHYRFIIAPHNIKEEQLSNLEKNIQGVSGRLSLLSEPNNELDVMLIDSIGYLSSIYQYGKIAYIGGGFGSNVHNILEAATYGIPTIFGPNYHKFQECIDLVAAKGAFSINSAGELNEVFSKLKEDEFFTESSKTARNYVEQKSGATEIVIQQLRSLKIT